MVLENKDALNSPAQTELLAAFGKRDAVAEREAKTSGQGTVVPKAPGSLSETGLSTSFLLELMLKVFHYVETPTTEHLAKVMCLPIKLVNELLESLKTDRLIEIIGGAQYGVSTAYKFRLTEKGEERAERALERCRYAGAAPVTLEQYERVIGGSDAGRWRPSVSMIKESFKELILDDTTADFLERALHSGRSLMLYGPSGNGKTTVLTEFIKHLDGEVLIPNALYAYGQIIRMFDGMVHRRVEVEPKAENGDGNGARGNDEGPDRRWVRAKRPGLLVGGEFTEESLELGYDPITRFYQAPKHLKAQGGVLVVDDFGRQKVSPSDLLNRWIMALERGRDNLLLRTGESIDVPFHLTILFSTNLNPSDLTDSAYLRRVPYKAYMAPADSARFAEILGLAIRKSGWEAQTDTVAAVTKFLEVATGGDLSGSLARDLVTIVLDNATHEGHEPVFDVAAFDLAYRQFAGIPDGQRPAPHAAAAQQ